MGRVIAAFEQFFDGDGDPLRNGWLKFLESNSNNTLKTTYSDSVMQIPNSNPVQLDGEGRCPDVYGTGDYRVISYTQDIEDEEEVGEQIQMFDPVTAQGSVYAESGFAFGEWNTTITYGLGDIVTSGNNIYRSLILANLSNNPATSEFAWERVDFLPWWNSSITYAEYAIVQYTEGLYISKAGSNLNHEPSPTSAYWDSVGAGGYTGYSVKSSAYTILNTEDKTIFVLDSSASGDAEFTLPAIGSSLDGFQIAFYNATSSHDMVVKVNGGDDMIWVGYSYDLIVGPGSFTELRCYGTTFPVWQVMGNNAYALGDQTLGAANRRLIAGYFNTLFAYNLGDTNYEVGNAYFDGTIYMGESQSAEIYYQPANGDSGLVLTSSGHIIFQASNDIQFQTDGLMKWYINTDGDFLPNSFNPNAYDIGSSSVPIKDLYIGDNSKVYFGSDQDTYLYFNTTDSFMYFNYGATAIILYNATAINLTQATYLDKTLDIEDDTRTTTRVAPAGTFVNSSSGDPVISTTHLNYSGLPTTWFSVGPTGSGASAIWTALDDVPTDVDWIEIKIQHQCEDSLAGAGVKVTSKVYVRQTGSSVGEGPATNISKLVTYEDSSANAAMAQVNCGIKIPVDSSLRFDLAWNAIPVGVNTTDFYIYLTGWGFNPT